MIESLILEYKPEINDGDYDEKELDCLKSLPKRTYLLEREQKLSAFCGLVDILFSYCYDKRINCGEENSESGWTIVKLSSTLSWLDVRTIK
jgi:protein SHQ1